jgi:hypothetical protein
MTTTTDIAPVNLHRPGCDSDTGTPSRAARRGWPRLRDWHLPSTGGPPVTPRTPAPRGTGRRHRAPQGHCRQRARPGAGGSEAGAYAREAPLRGRLLSTFSRSGAAAGAGPPGLTELQPCLIPMLHPGEGGEIGQNIAKGVPLNKGNSYRQGPSRSAPTVSASITGSGSE